MKELHMVTFLLTVVGALNWGLVGIFNFNVVASLLGAGSSLEKLIYVLVGASAVWFVIQHKEDCKTCVKK
ncbi:MAG: hypothetical protein A3F31_01480 [Candidatus Levybacteria bacterium RIFCSPHIGHO2_12_FULL_38_12]|nr:MAG: hypothetical protein A3D75_02270 [Candidatus Levybacteria bacterium RIFCSPHIGHO2_02_FULL_37_18]OGH22351.1 MAG: hypothetical protein A3F31_01480 [Candidatus Levybacteria bacterium RIFCSPHIGHO2_12_FULL_38_12]OGH34995.1 MAG: hypothetical protein A3A47_03125 [Candidatus Levybacteria bacterium RIFCSPLOWO2_01_FULL_37_20]OGH43874.1 MAG: hypothetical protein A3J14_02100 [Candidatus Levybacteria bacterium RIFCSPLOWO2_02_FULL_37_18]OGH51063.1 MAG: hypothetical protein A3G13_03020 [Candidatus Levy